jgi:hypothetical protein
VVVGSSPTVGASFLLLFVISTLGLFCAPAKKTYQLTGDNVSEVCTLPKSCVAGVSAVEFLFLPEMNEKETDLHQRIN